MDNQGIILIGKVIGRTKKEDVGKLMQTVITYKVQAENEVYYVKDWQPDVKDYLAVGTEVMIPIKISLYNGKFQYTVKRDNIFGEEF